MKPFEVSHRKVKIKVQVVFYNSSCFLSFKFKLFETPRAIKTKYGLTKSKIFFDEQSRDIDGKDFAVNRRSKCDSDASQKGKVVIENNNIFK